MKKYLFASLMCVGLASAAYAQAPDEMDDDQVEMGQGAPNAPAKPQKSPEQKAKAQSERLKNRLGLSDEQTQKVYDAALTRAKKVEEIRKRYAESRQKERSEIAATQQETDSQLKQILSPEQYAQLQSLKDNRRQGMPGRRPGEGGRKRKD